MTREIKFDYVCKCDVCGRIVHDYCTLEQIEERIDADFMSYWSCEKCADGILLLIDRRQFTTTHGCSHREIYEGDIVRRTSKDKPGTYVVIWDEYRVAWWLKNVKQRDLEYADDYCQLLNNGWEQDHNEVIGNKFDNPELLEDS